MESLHSDANQYYEFIEGANSIILRMDKDGKITFFNGFAEKFFGYSRQEILGRNVIGTIVPEADMSGADLAAMIKDICRHPDRYAVNENENICRDGRRVWIAWSNKAVRDKDGRASEVICIGNDITRRKRAEEALQKLTAELEERVRERTAELEAAYTKLKNTQDELIQAAKMQVVGRLASGVAHEVKNPLAIILQGVEYLEKKIRPKDANSPLVLGDIKEAVNRADKIIRELLDFSRPSKLEMEPASLNTLIEKALSLLKMPFEKNHIRLFKELALGIPDIKIDKNKMEQVFINIIMNAVQAMPEGGQISVRTYAKEGQACLEIQDNGPGIPQENLDKIFEPFFTTKRSSGGTGLGMSIVKNIIDMHNARIEIKNNPGGGLKVAIAFRVV